MGRFETEVMTQPDNLGSLVSLSGRWIDRIAERRPASASRARVQSRELHADAGIAGRHCEVVTDQPARKACEDRCEAHRTRALHDLPNGGGRRAARSVPAHSSDDRRASTKANSAMLSHAAPPHAPTSGGTASEN